MSISRRTKVALLITLLVLVSMTVGFFLGAIAAKAVAKKKDNPVFWKKIAMRQLDKLHPSEEQRKKFDARVDAAVKELVAVRKDVVVRAQTVVAKAAADIDKELTPEQREIFQKIKPKDLPDEEKESGKGAE